MDDLPDEAAGALDLDHLTVRDLPDLNRLCQAIEQMSKADREKLGALVQLTESPSIKEVCRLAENLDQFGLIPGVFTPEEYGKYMIRESGHFAYDENLEEFYDFRSYGEKCMSEKETYDIGLSRVTIRPGCYVKGQLAPNVPASALSIRTLSDAGGDALYYVKLKMQWCNRNAWGDRITYDALQKVSSILLKMDSARKRA